MKYLVYYNAGGEGEHLITILSLTSPNKFLILPSFGQRKRFNKKVLDYLFLAFDYKTQTINSTGVFAEALATNINKTKKLGTIRRILEEAEVLKKIRSIYIR